MNDIAPQTNDDDFVEVAARRLRVSTGFVEIPCDQPRPADYWDLSRAADQAAGVEVMSCGSPDYSAYVLYTKRYRVEWSDTKVLDLDLLAREAAEGDWDGKLARAVDALGMTPIQERPGWLLCAYYG